MGTIAKGEITLSPVNDAYTVLLTPATCTVNADFSGIPNDLSNTGGTLTVQRGTEPIRFHITQLSKSSPLIDVAYNPDSTVSMRFSLTGIPSTETSGWIEFTLLTEDGFDYTTTVRFAYSVVRESTMLDWIQDWEGSKTKIGGTYIMTPKLFVGKKEDIAEEVEGEWTWKENALTGVYIGSDLLNRSNYGVGIYGYVANNEIFHINADGGFIGGWTFNEDGLQSGNGIVKILTEGSIYAKPKLSLVPYWGLYADGSAQFANGNVTFSKDGSATYTGSITSSSGSIGGWTINSQQIYSSHLILDSTSCLIGIYPSVRTYNGVVIPSGSAVSGISIYYTSTTDYGICGQLGGEVTFQLGSTNLIAGWNFNHQAIWTGSEDPYLTQGAYAANSGELTLAPNGLRCHKWYIDADGTAAFVGGSVKFDTAQAEMFGWLMRYKRFSSQHAALVSESSRCGLFLSPIDLSEISVYSLAEAVSSSGGICLYGNSADSYLTSYSSQGAVNFSLTSTGLNTIGSWHFNNSSIHTGNNSLAQDGFTTDSQSLVLAPSGLVGYKWRLMRDGSGALAGGNISWDASGNVTLASSVTIAWANISGAIGNKLTKIDSNGIYTGTINADNITSGTLSSSRINADELLSNGSAWALKQDGSGYLASQNIKWEPNGDLTITGTVNATSGVFQGYLRTGLKALEDSDAQKLSTSSHDWLLVSDLNIIDDGGEKYIYLPTTDEMVGARVLIFNKVTFFSRTTSYYTRVRTNNGTKIIGILEATSLNNNDPYGHQTIAFQSGSIELLGVKIDNVVRWAVIGQNAAIIEGYRDA